MDPDEYAVLAAEADALDALDAVDDGVPQAEVRHAVAYILRWTNKRAGIYDQSPRVAIVEGHGARTVAEALWETLSMDQADPERLGFGPTAWAMAVEAILDGRDP